MSEPDDSGNGVHLEGAAYGQGLVNQAGRDLHVHYDDGVRRVTQTRGGAGAASPYPGLAAFTGKQAGWFFGRDELTADLLGRMDAALAGEGPVVVVAASGAGKSSLLQAGLLRKIADGALPAEGSRDWPQVVIVPGEHPMRAAAAALRDALPMAAVQQLPRDPGADDLDALLHSLARAIEVPGGQAARVVLVVDQFEELFTLCDDEAERGQFIFWLWRASGRGRGERPLAVVACGLRADFYAQCVAADAELRRSLQADQVVVGPMSERELRQAIAFPAQAVGLELEPGLADLLLSDLRASHDDRASRDRDHATADYDAGRLPLLAHALRAIWQQRHGSTLTVDGYRATGGIDHAIAETADRVYARLDPAGQREAKLIFLRLVRIGDAPSSDARRAVSRSGLATSSAASAVLDAYIDSRLLTSTQDAVQITHEALLGAWPKLKGWLEEDRAGNLTRQRTEDAAAEWQRSGREVSLLYRGASLEAAASWEDAHPGDLTQTARDFLAASRRLARRTILIRRSAISVLTALALIATTAAGIALWQRGIASQQRNQAIFNQVTAEAQQLQSTNQSLAAQLNLAAWRMDPTADLAARLRNTSTAALATPFTVPGEAPGPLAFSPHGHTLAVSYSNDSSDGIVWLWNVSDSAHPARIGQPLTVNLTAPVSSMAFSPGGHTLAASSGGSVWLWNVSDPARPTRIGKPLTGPVDFVSSVAFSPDGHTLAVGSVDGSVWLWNVSDPARPTRIGKPLTGPSGTVETLAFSPDGHTLAAGSDDTEVWLWNVSDPARPTRIGKPLTGPSDIVDTLAFSPDGHTLAVGSDDGTVWLWNIANTAKPSQIGKPLTGPTGGVSSVAFSPDGRTLAADSGEDGTVWLWNLPPTVVSGPNDAVSSVAYGHDGHTLAAGSFDGKVWLWNVSDPARPTPIGKPLTSSIGGVSSVAFSPDGHTLAAGTADGTVWLWNVSDPARPTRIGKPLTGPSDVVSTVAFSPDGQTLAAGNTSLTPGSPFGTVWLWNVSDPARPTPIGKPLTGPTSTVSSVAFSPDGHTLAAGSNAGTVWQWNVTNPARPTPIDQPLTGPASSVTSVAFSPDGRALTVGSEDGITWSWNLNLSQVIDRICATTSGDLTPSQWTHYIPQLPYSPPCHRP